MIAMLLRHSQATVKACVRPICSRSEIPPSACGPINPTASMNHNRGGEGGLTPLAVGGGGYSNSSLGIRRSRIESYRHCVMLDLGVSALLPNSRAAPGSRSRSNLRPLLSERSDPNLVRLRSIRQNSSLIPNWIWRGLSADRIRPNVGEPRKLSGKSKFG